MVTKILSSNNLTHPRIMDVSQATTKGMLVPVPYRCIPGTNTLTTVSSITMQVVLQGNPMPLTLCLHSSTGPLGN